MKTLTRSISAIALTLFAAFLLNGSPAAATVLIGPTTNDGSFNTGTDQGSIGGGLGNVTAQIGLGPWNGMAVGVLGLLLQPTVSVVPGQAQITGLLAVGVVGNLVQNKGAAFQTITGVPVLAHTSYTLTGTVSASSALTLQALSNSGVGVALTAGGIQGASPSPGTDFAVQSDAAFFVNLVPINATSATFTFTFITGATVPSGDIGVRLFSGESNGLVSITVLSTVSFGSVMLTADPVGAPIPAGVVSRKVHAVGGPFDIPLPVVGNPGIECRTGGANGDFQLVFNFLSPVILSGATVTSGTGSVVNASASGSVITVNLTGVTNRQLLTVTLIGVSDGIHFGNVSATMGVLLGDTTGDRFVNSGDTTQTRGRSGQQANNTNFRSDVNLDGTINGGDAVVVRSSSGTTIP
ncbi:MAG: hypothetical protein ACR2ID_10595 [Chthoniobacterales bacterium]